ncbi:hypothetical protein C2S52_008564 [Perilla frutescens var. hirtella]|nr:hypothetical protein C2S51_017723 [Perilla frutescens var. frutescens]KAH6783605.1 hypothetical protein C2S52_008564 [Perilla frutescens var. hirtella]
MVDKSKKGKKGTISEEDMSALLQRYSMNTVLGMLQEVEQSAGEKVDWREVAKNSATGISGAREYQMLWRHLAYGETLIDQLDNDAEPIDDDSDLEYEVEAFPSVGREASVEAAACVKVLIASGYPYNSLLPSNSTIEAPLTINIPKSKAVSTSSDGSLLPIIQGTNISIPVSVHKQPLSSGVSGEKRPNNEVSEMNLPSRRRRRSWSLEDDTKLTASVQKHGERNWANIARWDFKNDRRPSELSQRWSNLRKKQGNTKVGTSSQPPSETQLAAAHRAMSLALNMPMGDNLKSAAHMAAAGIKTQHQPQKASASPADKQFQRVGPSKPQMLANRLSMNPISERDSMVKAAAVAAGARIATPADASSLIEAARSQNVVHITTGGSSVMKSSSASVAHQLPSNVHFIRNGLAKAPISTYSAPKLNIPETGEAKPAQSRPAKPAASAVHNPMGAVPVLNSTSVKENAAASTPSTKLPGTAANGIISSDNKKKDLHHSNQGADPGEISGCAPVEQQPENRPAASGSQSEVENNQTSSGNAPKENTEGDKASVPVSEPLSRAIDGGIALPSSEVEEDDGKSSTGGDLSSKETVENPNSNGKHDDVPSTSTNEPAI